MAALGLLDRRAVSSISLFSAEQQQAAMMFTVKVVLEDGKMEEVQCDDGETVKSLKGKMEKPGKKYSRVMKNGKSFEDDKTLKDCGIWSGMVLELF